MPELPQPPHPPHRDEFSAGTYEAQEGKDLVTYRITKCGVCNTTTNTTEVSRRPA